MRKYFVSQTPSVRYMIIALVTGFVGFETFGAIYDPGWTVSRAMLVVGAFAWLYVLSRLVIDAIATDNKHRRDEQ